jgi:PAS domain S-box-containing protein
MNIENIDKLSREELVKIIEKLNQQYEINFDSSNFKSLDFSTIVEAAYDIIFVIDKELRIQYMNRAWIDAFPTRESIPGKNYRDYLHEIELERGNFVVDSVLNKGQVFRNELLKIYENDKPYYFVTNFSPIKAKSGEIVALIGVMRNYTEQYQIQKKLKENTIILEQKVQEQIKQAEELKHLKDLNEEIINNAPVGMFMVDPSGIVINENPMLSTIMAREPNTLIGVNIIKYKGFVDSGFTAIFNQVLEIKKTIKANERKYTPISGRKDLVVNVTFDPILNRLGAVERILIMIEDVTEQAETRNKVSRSEKMSALGLLASGVASELKSHINKMVMDLNFVDTNVDEYSPAAEYIDSLKKELERIKNISEQLLSLAIIDERDKEKCEINKVITSHPVDVFINKIRNDGHEVDVILPDMSPEIFATHNQIQQMLIQFLENSEDALIDGGKITIKVETVKTDENLYAVITLTDTGVGIPKENINKIFQPFFTTKGKKGTGLGMMIATNIISNIGGTIGVKSNPGEGTSIKVILPQIN